jgi:hypothetical protein
VKPPFVGPSYDIKVRKADVQRSVNLMPTPVEAGNGKAGVFLKPVPGLVAFSEGGGGGVVSCDCATVSARVVASDGFNATGGSVYGFEYLLPVGGTLWWSGHFAAGASNKNAIIDDIDVTGGYPGPTNYTAIPTAFDVFGWVSDGTYVWAFNGTTITRVTIGSLAVSTYTRSVDTYSIHIDPLGNVWIRDVSNNLRMMDKSNPATDAATRLGSQHSQRVLFTGGAENYAFYTSETNPPFGNPKLFRLDGSGNEVEITLSGTARPEWIVHDTVRASVWCWFPQDERIVEVSIASATEIRGFDLATLANAPNANAVYDPITKLIWATHNVGGTQAYVLGVCTTDGALKFEELIDVPRLVSVYSTSGPTLVVGPNGGVFATAIVEPTGVEPLYDDETVVIEFTCV